VPPDQGRWASAASRALAYDLRVSHAPSASGAPELPAAVLFDWDGTIVDSLPQIYRANVIVLGELGIRVDRRWFAEQHSPDWRRSYRELGIPESRWEELGARWEEEMRRGRPRAIPWVRGALRRLHRRGVKLGLVTASTRSVVLPSLDRLNLAGVFGAMRFADDVDNGKPHPEALLAALAELDVPPAAAVYVGDTLTDLEMARAAGARFVAVGDTTARRRFLGAGADRVWPGVGAWTDELLGGHQAPGAAR
jgi:HAD superfamily hydrolase (TIGR01509 family)